MVLRTIRSRVSDYVFLLLAFAFVTPVVYSFLSETFFISLARRAFNAQTLLLLILFTGGSYLLLRRYQNQYYSNFLVPIILAAFYLTIRVYNLDFPLFVVLIYMNALYYLGNLIGGSNGSDFDFSYEVGIGAVVFVLVSLALSLTDLAYGSVLWIILILVNLFAFYQKRDLFRKLHFLGLKLLGVASSRRSHFLIVVYITLFLVLIFQANNQPSYDEFWYSLRTHELLNTGGSFFEPIIYPDNWVAYYPKMAEVLNYPLQVFDNYAFSKIFYVCIWVFVSTLILRILSDQNSLSEIRHHFVLPWLLIITIPTLGDEATSTKGSILSLLYYLLSVIHFFRFRKTRSYRDLAFVICFALISMICRLSAIPFVALLGLLVFVDLVTARKRTELVSPFSLNDLAVFICCLLVFIAIVYRTYNLTGVPFVQIDKYPFVGELYELVGFQFHELLDNFRYYQGKTIGSLEALYQVVFDPARTRAGNSWYSNFSIFILSFILLGYLLRGGVAIYRRWDVLVGSTFLLTAIILTSILWRKVGQVGGDGNYLLVPFVLSSILFMRVLIRGGEMNGFRSIVFAVYIVIHCSLIFLVGMDWAPGIRKAELSIDKNPFTGVSNQDAYRRKLFATYYLEDISDHLPLKKSDCFIAGTGSEKLLYSLGCKYLNLRNVENTRTGIFSSYDLFREFLLEAGITHLLVQQFPNESRFYKYCEYLISRSDVKTFHGVTYKLLDITGCDMRRDLGEMIPERERGEVNIVHTLKWTDIVNRHKDTRFVPFDKYYQEPVFLLKNGSNLDFEIELGENESDLYMEFHYATHYSRKIIKGQGELVVTILDDEDLVVSQKKLAVKQDFTYYEKLFFNPTRSRKLNISFDFVETGWRNPVDVVITQPRIYSLGDM